MNYEPQLTTQSKLLELKRFLNRIGDISFSYSDLKNRIYRENPTTDEQITLLQQLVDEAVSVLNTKYENNNK